MSASPPAATAASDASLPSPNYCTSHFITGSYAPVVSFLDDVGYARCLDTLVKACNDLLLTCEGKIFLGKRQVFPQKDWWYGCGGRMKPGENLFECAKRLFARELKLEFSVEELQRRLMTVGSYSFLWGKREQLPQTNGTADISVVVTLALTAAEKARIVPDEFEQRAWVTPQEILDGPDYHPALKRSCQDYVKLQRFRELDQLLLGKGEKEAAVVVPPHPLPAYMAASSSPSSSPSSSSSAAVAPASTDSSALTDAELLAKVRSYFQYHRFISQRDTENVPCKETL